jgi:hypothetical protein
MRAKKPMALNFTEKFLGVLIIVIGALTVNFTYSNPPEEMGAPLMGIFIAVGIVLIAIGVFLVLVKAE